MRKLLAFLLFLFWVAFAIVARWYFVCELLGECGEAQEVVDIRSKTLQLTEGDSLVILSGYDEFKFDRGLAQPILNDNNLAFLDTLAYLLRQDTTKDVVIIGRHIALEAGADAGFQENMGKARASAIQQLLVQRGIPVDFLQLEDELSTDTLLQAPLAFELTANNLPDQYAEASFTFTNMTYSDANFAYNDATFLPGDGFKFYADSVLTYMMDHPEMQLRIVGHTDSIGGDSFNHKLGLRRAENTKIYLDSVGLDPNTIIVESRGRTEPITDSSTDEGRQENRRVNFIIEEKSQEEK